MTDLRKAIIKLAYDNPEIREDLVPLLRDAGNKDTFKIAEFPHEGYAMRRTETHRRRFAFDTSDAEDHLAGWNRGYTENYGTRQHIPGFLTWAWDLRKETLKDLDRRNYGAIAEELAYSAKQDPAYRDESYADLEAGFVDYLKNWRTELLEALDESLFDRNASSRNRQADGSTFTCPHCEGKVLEQTKYCVSCQKKVKKSATRRRARFEEGVPADPTQNMTPEEAAEWEAMNEKYKDKLKKERESALRDDLIRLAYNKPELRGALLPILK